MSRETIAVDIDDVAADENQGMREFVNREYGFSHTPEDYLVDGVYRGYWEAIWKQSPERAKEIYEAFVNSPDKANLKPIEGSIEAIRILKEKYDLVVITSRDGPAVPITKPWLERHFPDTFRQVEFVSLWNHRPNVTKAIIGQEIGADYMIDDNAGHCNLAAEIGIRALLFGDYGWNRQETVASEVTRVKNWQEVLGYFNARP